MSDSDNILAFDALIAGTDVPGNTGIALDTSGTSGFGGRGIATFTGVGDIDGDGQDDLAAGSLWALSRDGVTVGNFSVFTGLGDADVDGIVRPTPIFRTPGTDNSLEGYSFSSLGDFDGDGLQEILVGRDPRVTLGNEDVGGHIRHEFDNGVVIGERISSFGGSETDFVGDLNNDGFDEILLTSNNGGVGHEILLGNAESDFSQRLSIDGFGGASAYVSGHAVSGGVDVSGDGIVDFALLNNGATAVTLIHGSADLAARNLDINNPDSGTVLQLPGRPLSIELLTDFNGDGQGDLLISFRGGAAVVFGATDIEGSVNLASLQTDQGLFVEISNPNHVAYSAGDLNGDGLSDINFSDRQADGSSDTGIVFGAADRTGSISLDDLDGSNGFRITGARAGEGIGDSNGDGFDDLLLRVGQGVNSFAAIVEGGASAAAEPPRPPVEEAEEEPAPAPAPPPEDEPAPPPPAPPPEEEPAPPPPAPRQPGSPTGSSEADFMLGTAGDDTLVGLGGNDTIDGNDGSDQIEAGDGSDRIRGGRDEGSDTLFGGLGNDSMSGGSGNDTLSGDEGNDLLVGDSGDDDMFGGLGDDFLKGGSGTDNMFGGEGRDTLVGQDGNDILSGGQDKDVLRGGAGEDVLEGGDGVDRLHGGAGADTLTGGSGNDYLFGEDGADTFVFESGTGIDEIADFDQAEGDRLDFTQLGVALEDVAVNVLSGNLVLDLADIRVVLEGVAAEEVDLSQAGLF